MKTFLKTFVDFILGIWNVFLFRFRRILFRMSRFLEGRSKKNNNLAIMEPLELSKICSLDKYQIYHKSMREEFIKRENYEQAVEEAKDIFNQKVDDRSQLAKEAEKDYNKAIEEAEEAKRRLI